MVSIPDIVARGQQFRLVRQDESLRRFNGSEQIVMNRVAYWSFQIPLLPRTGADAKGWRAALTELANPAETFLAGPPGYRGSAYVLARIQGPTALLLSNGNNLLLSNGNILFVNSGISGGGSVVVSGAGQLGYQLTVSGADANQILFLPGEYFSVNGELKVVTAQCNTSGTGTATVVFSPALRSPPPNSATLEMLQPQATFRLAASAPWMLQPNRIHTAMIDAVESYE